jgi:hypothetical protein
MVSLSRRAAEQAEGFIKSPVRGMCGNSEGAVNKAPSANTLVRHVGMHKTITHRPHHGHGAEFHAEMGGSKSPRAKPERAHKGLLPVCAISRLLYKMTR